MKITILGCGSSSGVPEIGCSCPVCRSNHSRNKRTRVSILIETKGKRFLVDASPDLRFQALKNNITNIDAVLFTHDHADHTHGIDDLRAFNIQKDASLPIYGDVRTLESIQNRFSYAFQSKPEVGIWFRPSLSPMAISEDMADFEVEGIKITPILQHHAKIMSLGFRIGNFAYCTDVNCFPEASLPKLKGLDIWIVDCLRYTPSPTHSRVELTLEWIDQVRPKRAILTHMAHQLDYEALCKELPENVEPAYDGMVVELAD